MFVIISLAVSLTASLAALALLFYQRGSEEYQAMQAASFFADSERKDLRNFVMMVGELRETFERLEMGVDE